MASLDSGLDCICKVCSCGKHKLCKPLWTFGPKLEAHSEYCENYQKYPQKCIIRGKSAAPVQVPRPGGTFYGQTESREQFVIHQIPPRISAKKADVVLEGGSFESVTTQKYDYKSFKGVKVAQRRPPTEVWVSTSGGFDGTTTNKSDYQVFPLPTKFQRQQAEYVKTDVPFESISTQAEDYQKWAVTNIPKRRKDAIPYFSNNDDRDFQSTTTASYVGHSHKRILAKKVYDIPVSEKFVATTSSKLDYLKWNIPPKYERPKAVYVYNSTPFVKKTEYRDTFIPKKTNKYVHVMPPHVPNDAKFEAKSTHKNDFNSPGPIKKTEDYRPRNKYIQVSDSRDFVTTTKGSLDVKTLPPCPASQWMKEQRSIHADGHVYLAKA